MSSQHSAGYVQCAVRPGTEKADQAFSPGEVIALHCFNFRLRSRSPRITSVKAQSVWLQAIMEVGRTGNARRTGAVECHNSCVRVIGCQLLFTSRLISPALIPKYPTDKPALIRTHISK